MHSNQHNFTRGVAINPGTRPQQLAPITLDQVRRAAPSAFAQEAHQSRSDRYVYIPTSRVIEQLMANGFAPVSASQSRCLREDKREYTKHAIKFVSSTSAVKVVGDSVPQITLVNSHDGSSGYKLFAGMFRLACSNGLMVCDGEFDSISVRHSGKIIDEVIEGSFEVIDVSVQACERIGDWKRITLDPKEQLAFANAAMDLRFGEIEERKALVRPEQVLVPRRPEDAGNDLWSTFNRVQEHLVKGGNRYRTREGRRMSTREVTGIDNNISLNRALWRLADEMRALKAA